MHYSLLNLIVCPACKGKLEIKNEELFNASDVISGELVCATCMASFAIRNSIPRFVPSGSKDAAGSAKILQKTRERFSFSWKIFTKREKEEDWFKDSYAYLKKVPLNFLNTGERTILDLGCGMGSDIPRFSRANTNVIGVDFADSIEVVNQRFKGKKNIQLVQADIYNLPFKADSFDLIYCLGVLHHLPNIKQAFKNMVDLTKEQGALLIYLYEDFSDRGPVLRFLLNSVNMLRLLTKHMDTRILYVFCLLFTPFIWFFLSLPAFILNHLGLKKLSNALPFRHTLNMNCLAADLYDRFSPPIEKRYSQQQVRDLFKDFSLNDITVFKYRGWVAFGTKSKNG